MKTFTDDQYATFFKMAAIYNFIAAAGFLLLPDFGSMMFLKKGALENFYAHMFYNFTWAFVFIFGIGYYIVGLDVDKNHGIVLIGIIGKLFFYVYFLYLFTISRSTLFSVAGVTGDLLFSVAFAYFLFQKKKKSS